jgi:hypothetical protein
MTMTAGSKKYSGVGDDYQVGEPYSCQRVEIGDSVPLSHSRQGISNLDVHCFHVPVENRIVVNGFALLGFVRFSDYPRLSI